MAKRDLCMRFVSCGVLAWDGFRRRFVSRRHVDLRIVVARSRTLIRPKPKSSLPIAFIRAHGLAVNDSHQIPPRNGNSLLPGLAFFVCLLRYVRGKTHSPFPDEVARNARG